MCTTIFGRPVVPDVNMLHSVWQWVGTGGAGFTSGRQTTPNGDAERRMIERFVVGDDRVDLRGGDQCRQVLCSTSEGQSVIRRATPSSSIRASAVVS